MSAMMIQINFQNAMQQARELESCATELRNAMKRMDGIEEGLRSGWSGEAANQYMAKCEAMKDRFSVSADNLMQIAGAIRTAAQAYYEAEMRALEIIAAQAAAAAAAAASGGSGAAGGGGSGGGR